MPIRSPERFVGFLGIAKFSSGVFFALHYHSCWVNWPCRSACCSAWPLGLAGLGFLLNIRFGSSPAPYALC